MKPTSNQRNGVVIAQATLKNYRSDLAAEA
jgi:hypothetical protein